MKKIHRLIAALLTFLLIMPMLFLPAYAEDDADDITGDDGNANLFDANILAASDKIFTVVVDYYAERLLIIPYDTDKDTDIIEISDKQSSIDYKNASEKFQGVNFMYALKVTSNEVIESYDAKKKLSAFTKDKWYPLSGGEVSIEKAIPKKPPTNANKTYYIAVRVSTDKFTGTLGYRTRVTVPIKSRYYDKSLKKLLEYDADAQEYRLSSAVAFAGDQIMFSFDNFGYTTRASDAPIKVDSEFYFNGGSLKVKTAPISSGDGVQYASSAVIKYTIPKAGASPAVKVDSKKAGLVSLKKDKMEYCIVDPSGFASDDPNRYDAWQTYTDSSTTVLYTEFESKLDIEFEKLIIEDRSGKQVSSSTGGECYYIIYFRTKAVSKKTPPSPPKKIKISCDEVRVALAAAAD